MTIDDGLIPMVGALPEVQVVRRLRSASFKINGKVFAFTNKNKVMLKLPVNVIAKVLNRPEVSLLTMGKRTLKEWIVVRYAKPTDCKNDLALFKQSIGFVRRHGSL